MKMTANELSVILEQHKKWLLNEEGGSRADLSGADLRGADLSGADLSYAYLRGAYLSRADLSGAYLRGANLIDANLSGANLIDANLIDASLIDAYLIDAYLIDANLIDANLIDANLSGADLRGADLSGADLRGADLRGAKNLPDLPWTSIVPEMGSFIGWKKVHSKEYDMPVIIKLEILADAKRCNATGRKCRCSAAKVLEIQKMDGSPAGIDKVENTAYTPHVFYTVGETVLPDSFDDDRWNECSHGIHFFITRQEAVNYWF